MKHIGAFAYALLSFGLIIAQTSLCTTEDLSGKALKYFEKADQPKKKTTTDDRIEYLRIAIDEQDDYAEAYELLSALLFKKSRKNSENISECLSSINKWIELCEDYNPEAHYMIGALAFTRSNTVKAIDQFELFWKRP